METILILSFICLIICLFIGFNLLSEMSMKHANPRMHDHFYENKYYYIWTRSENYIIDFSYWYIQTYLPRFTLFGKILNVILMTPSFIVTFIVIIIIYILKYILYIPLKWLVNKLKKINFRKMIYRMDL